MGPNSTPPLVVFDIDGTLYQTERSGTAAVVQAFEALGQPTPDLDKLDTFTGQPVERAYEWLRTLLPPAHRAGIAEDIDRRELELIRTEGALYPGIEDVLETLAAEGYALACCSNGTLDYVETIAEVFGLCRHFPVLLCRGMGYAGKADMLAEILKRHGIAGPNPRGVMVGDRGDDIEAAQALGLKAVAACYGFGSEKERAGADAHVAHPCELVDAVKRLLPL